MSKTRAKTTKIRGWKDCEVERGDMIDDDSMEGTTNLSREEGQVEEAPIESGESEGTYKAPDKYILEIKRRIGPNETVTAGFNDNVGNVEVRPKKTGARTVQLTGVSQDISVEYGSDNGAVEVIRWKTKGAVNDNGNLTDVIIGTVGAQVGG